MWVQLVTSRLFIARLSVACPLRFAFLLALSKTHTTVWNQVLRGRWCVFGGLGRYVIYGCL